MWCYTELARRRRLSHSHLLSVKVWKTWSGNLQLPVVQLSWDDSDSESFQGSDWGSFWNSNWESDWRTGAASGVQSSYSWLQGLHTHSTGSAENMQKLRGNPAGRMKTEENKEKREGFNPTWFEVTFRSIHYLSGWFTCRRFASTNYCCRLMLGSGLTLKMLSLTFFLKLPRWWLKHSFCPLINIKRFSHKWVWSTRFLKSH